MMDQRQGSAFVCIPFAATHEHNVVFAFFGHGSGDAADVQSSKRERTRERERERGGVDGGKGKWRLRTLPLRTYLRM